MKAAPTPGPWAAAEETFDNGGITEIVIRGSDPRAAVAVALDFGKNNPAWQLANARLIAAAPELLEVAKLFAAYEDAMDRDDHIEGMRLYNEASKKVRLALQKAQGEI